MNISVPIYMDYSATTPVDERVAEKMCACLTRQGLFGLFQPAPGFLHRVAVLDAIQRDQLACLPWQISRAAENSKSTCPVTAGRAVYWPDCGCSRRNDNDKENRMPLTNELALPMATMMLLTLLNRLRQLALGLPVLSAVGLSFSILTFFPMGAKSKTVSLKTASYGVKSCSSPTKEIYLIFSSDCPHCQKVIETLNNCNSCDLYLNPIETVKSLNLSGLELNQQFSPEINRMILKVLAIDSVPVLVVKDAESYRFIRGEETIINFIRRACFTHEEVLYFDESPFSSDSEITVFTDTDEECSLAIDCDSNNASPTD